MTPLTPTRRAVAAGRRSPRPTRTELPLWRTRVPQAVRPAELGALATSLPDLPFHDERRWRQACTWDAAEAIGIALRQMRRWGPSGARVDIAMGAVLVHAMQGDAASCHVLSHALRRRGRGGDAAALRLAAHWSRWPAGNGSRRPRPRLLPRAGEPR